MDTALGVGRRRLPLWGFAVIVAVYLLLIQGVGLAVDGWAELDDDAFTTAEQVLVHLWIPLGVALSFVYGVVATLGWWRPVLHDDRPVQRWVWAVPAIFLAGIVLGINYPQLLDNGVGFTLALLLATQLVGWGEEGMFRGIGVTVLRDHGLAERKVALWSSLVFGAVHLSNAVGRGAGAIPQAVAVSFAGYFFYLIRRVSKGNVANSVIHGLFDFSLLSV
ncbi:MAG TPA: CPBP family glutamic-type intramembrane protease, partial [Iamia sp.]|nr:CPBP family glutamic-type intramembrane protease [Iamia sp.]